MVSVANSLCWLLARACNCCGCYADCAGPLFAFILELAAGV